MIIATYLFLSIFALLVGLCYGHALLCKVPGLRQFILPQVFVDLDVGFGLKKANALRNYAVSTTIAIDGVVVAILAAITGRKIEWLYRPARVRVKCMAPNAWAFRGLTDPENKEQPSLAFRRDYMQERAQILSRMITTVGWRAWLLRGLVELPQTRPDAEGTWEVDYILY